MNRTQLAPPDDIRIRPAHAADCAAIGAFVAGLSPRARFLRFFGPASPPSSSVLRSMCGAGLTSDVLLATDRHGHGQGDDRDNQGDGDYADRMVIGHAMAADSVAPDGALVTDVGLVVADRWQHHGVGSDLLGRLVARAQKRGVSRLSMDVLPENRPMLTLIAHRWPDARYAFGPDAVTVRVGLTSPSAANGGRRDPALRAA
ncbi:MAG TPA: GNAT family N-acetyltransferase [Streptosporangiaceae bacterium]|nr:GNAT family N-acetyltransferase [Streptosporangiaceae bacterium]